MTQQQLVTNLEQHIVACHMKHLGHNGVRMAMELIGAMMDIEFQALCHRAHILRVQEEEDTC